MKDAQIVDELVKFGTDSIKVFGKRAGGAYVKRCLPMWSEQYGDAVAQRVRLALAAAWREGK